MTTNKAKQITKEQALELVGYFDSQGEGISVSTFLDLVEAIDPEMTQDAFTQVKLRYAPANNKTLRANAQAAIGRLEDLRDLNMNFPKDEDFVGMVHATGLGVLSGKDMVKRPIYGDLQDAVAANCVQPQGLSKLKRNWAESVKNGNEIELLDTFPKMMEYADGKDAFFNFKPKYRACSIDTEFLTRALDPRAFSKFPEGFRVPSVEAAKYLERGISQIAVDYVLANGDAQSQLGRLKRNAGIRSKLLGKDVTGDPWTDAFNAPYARDNNTRAKVDAYVAEMFEIVDEHMEEEEETLWSLKNDTIMLVNAKYLTWKGTGRSLLSFNKHSGAGLLFPPNMAEVKPKIGNVIPQDIWLAQLLVDRLSRPRWELENKFAAVVELKPKWEPIEIEKNVERVRNICNAPTCAQLVMGMMCRGCAMQNMVAQWVECRDTYFELKGQAEDFERNLLFDSAKKLRTKMAAIIGVPSDTHKPLVSARHLLGFNPFDGGMDMLLEFCTEYVTLNGREIIFTYADNMYGMVKVDGKWCWLSADGNGFESQMIRHVMTRFGKKVSRATGAEGKWRTYAEEAWAGYSYNVVGVLGKFQFKIPGLASGTAATAYANTERMLDLVACWRFCGYPPVIESQVLEGKKQFVFHKEFQKVLNMAMLSLSITECHKMDFNEEATFMQFDLLGFDGVGVVINGKRHFAAILSEEKLLKAIAFNKNDAVKTDFTSAQKVAMRLMKYRLLYMIGGWAYQAVSLALTNLCLYTVGRIQEEFEPALIQQVLEELEDDAELTLPEGEDVETFMMGFVKSAVPTPADVMKFTFGKDLAAAWKKDLQSKSIKLVVSLAGYEPDDALIEEDNVRPPTIPEEVQLEAQPKVKLPKRLPEVPSSVAKVADRPLKPAEKLIQAQRDLFKGGMGAEARYKRLGKEDKQRKIDEARKMLKASKVMQSINVLSLFPGEDTKKAKFDFAAYVANVTGHMLYIVLDAMDQLWSEKPITPLTDRARAHYMMRLAEELTAGDDTRNIVNAAKRFVTEFEDLLVSGYGENPSWADMADMESLWDQRFRKHVANILDRRGLTDNQLDTIAPATTSAPLRPKISRGGAEKADFDSDEPRVWVEDEDDDYTAVPLPITPGEFTEMQSPSDELPTPGQAPTTLIGNNVPRGLAAKFSRLAKVARTKAAE